MNSSPTNSSNAGDDDNNLVEVTMPPLGTSITEGTILEWRKAVGERVEMDEMLLEVSTDKIDSEIPSPTTGVVEEILVAAGATVDAHTVIATIRKEGGAAPAPTEESRAALDEEAAVVGELPDEMPSNSEPIDTVVSPSAATPPSAEVDAEPRRRSRDRPPISPVVRRIAKEHKIPSGVLAGLAGSGRGGRVNKQDLLSYIEAQKSPPMPTRPRPVLHTESPYREDGAPAAPDGLSLMRRKIGEHMVESLHTAAHCTTVMEVDMSEVEVARGDRYTYLPFVAAAVMHALIKYPALNARFDGDTLVLHEEINLGIAVSLGSDGLIVPVLENAHEYSVAGLHARFRDLAHRARNRKLEPHEVGSGTFTITNPGRYGALIATPIINQPQVAILDIEAVVKRPVVIDDAIAIRPMCYLCMSWDHRALDGALAAQFLAAVKAFLERGQFGA